MTRTLAETIPSLSLRIPVTDFSDTIMAATIPAPLGRGVVVDRRGADERTERAMGRRGWGGEVASVRE
ncbi:hypothetical protein L1887_28683 [Cichorium endivia]|nr:hypothetical protein L1887_28683 [Cichorium endivia]